MMLDCDVESSELGSEEFDTLSDIASGLSTNMQETATILNAYEEQLKFIRGLLKPFDHAVLQGLSSILAEGLAKLVDEKRPLTSDECHFLKKIPEILSEYAYIPTSKIPDAHLLTHFKNPLWIRPVNAQEEKEFIQFLIDGSSAPVIDAPAVSVIESPEVLELPVAEEVPATELSLSDLLVIEKSAGSISDPDVDDTVNEEPSVQISSHASEQEPDYVNEIETDAVEAEDEVLDLSNLLSKVSSGSQAESAIEESDELNEVVEEAGYSEDSILDLSELITTENEDELIQAESAEASEQEETGIELLSEQVADIHSAGEPEPEPEFESEVNIMDMLSAQPEHDEPEPDIVDVEQDEPVAEIQSESAFVISPDQQELVTLIGDELEEIISEKELTTLNTSEGYEQQKEHLITIAEQAENISNAIDLIGLEGLGNACRYISGYLHSLSDDVKNLSNEHVKLIESWPNVILSYLYSIAGEKSSDDLMAYLKNTLWTKPISSKAESALMELLKKPELEEEEKQLRQSQANADDMTLELPDDVNPELLEGLLQDLPVQSGEFSVAIQNLQDQKNLEYLEVAQRIAHTLKGAGNVVGVKGIANLTHHLEDILEIQSKANKLPSKALFQVLVDASDCLETMSEALLGIDEAPDNGLSVYQSVLDWANKLDVEGATEYSETEDYDTPEITAVPASAAVEKQVSIEEMTEEVGTEKTDQGALKKPVNIENMLRVPARLADDLLRLAGENLISTSQIQEYIKVIQNRYKSLKNHDQILQKLSFDLEHIVDVQGIANNNNQNSIDDGFDPLELDQYHELHSMSRRLVEIAADSIELTQVLENDFVELQNLVITQDKLQKENEELVLRTRMVPTNTIIPRLKRGVKQACRLTGKQVELDVIDSETYMDSEVLNGLIEPLMHVLRNSVDHGIESPEERKKSGKNPKGLIKLVFIRRGDQIVINVQDDGKGLDIEKIREKALLMGMVNTESEVTELNLQKFILQPGFSTRKEVSQVSGRGIGLDVVNSKIRELKGSIQVSSDKGHGCVFSLTLPISSFSVHSLLVRVRENIYAFSNRGVEEILYPGLGELQEIGNETMYKLNDQFYNITMIETLLNIAGDRRDVERSNRPVVLIKDDNGAHTAILVQEVIDSRDVVVKSMGPYIPKVPGVVGATVLGDGSIAPVIDLPELMQSAKVLNGKISYHRQEAEVEAPSRLPYVLVVDDSLSARKSLAQFVQDLGLDVRTARDGMEAVSLIDVRKPDLILVDMEMPRMNGLELTSHIRAGSNTQDMPVIMITSRSTDKHRKAAIDKGVDHYMVKPFAEDELASHINHALKIA